MEFDKFDLSKIDKSNVDYEVELFWYGFKSTVNREFPQLVDEMKSLAQQFNVFQSENNHDKIYKSIREFMLKVLDTFVNSIRTQEDLSYQMNMRCGHVESWLKRYNRISCVEHIDLPSEYRKTRKMEFIQEDEITLTKFRICKYILEKNDDVSLLLDFDVKDKDKQHKYLDLIVCRRNQQIFNMFSLKYNLQDYYTYRHIDKLYRPVEYKKSDFFIV